MEGAQTGRHLGSIASPPSPEAAAAHGVRQAFVFTQPNAMQLAEIAKLADAEKVKAIVETILPLSDATRGQELSGAATRAAKLFYGWFRAEVKQRTHFLWKKVLKLL